MGLELSDKTREKFDDLTSRFPDNKAAIVPALLIAQEEFGWISVEVMNVVAEQLNVEQSQVLSTATFYTMLNKQPIGKCHIEVCTTLTCATCGGYKILEYLEEKLGIQAGETTADGKFTLSEVECLASCGTAPMFQVTYSDGEIEYHEDLTVQKVDDLIDDFERKIEDLPVPKQMQ
jgi:NADH-quinone oxidoreductase subunit E